MTETETGRISETGSVETEDRDPRGAMLRPARPSMNDRTETPAPETNDVTETETRAPKGPGRFRQWRDRRTQTRTDRRDQIEQTRAAALAARQADRLAATEQTENQTETDIAPIPPLMKWAAVWLDRTFGAVPLAAPLVVSGIFTMKVFTDAPLNTSGFIAFAATCALEGGVWKLSRLYEKTLVAGDSTIALRLGIGVYLAIISGLIYWHAAEQAKLAGKEQLGYDAMPAFGVAVMSALGVFIWSRTARWQRRRELHALGRIDRQAPKFAALSWFLTPIETPKALRHAVKFRIESPTEALADRRLYVAAGRPAIWPPLPETGTGTVARTVRKPAAQTAETATQPVTRVSAETVSAGGDQSRETAPAPKPKTTSLGLHVAGRPTDPEYVQMVRDRYKDWSDPNRAKPVSAAEVMAATGLRGKPVALRIQKLLYAESPATETGRREPADDAKEDADVRPLAAANA